MGVGRPVGGIRKLAGRVTGGSRIPAAGVSKAKFCNRCKTAGSLDLQNLALLGKQADGIASSALLSGKPAKAVRTRNINRYYTVSPFDYTYV